VQKIKDNLGLIFISLVTILYLWLVCNLVINVEDAKALKLNEKGDFLAGIFSPLAFLWLVYGYLQQGQELKQNTKALNMQAEELRISNESLRQQVVEMGKSVKAQQDMFLLAEKQYQETIFEKQKSLIPQLVFIPSDYSKTNSPTLNGDWDYKFILELKIQNQPIKSLKIRSNFWYISISGGTMNNSLEFSTAAINVNKTLSLYFYARTRSEPFNRNIINVDYYDENDTKHSSKYEVIKNEDNLILFKDITTVD